MPPRPLNGPELLKRPGGAGYVSEAHPGQPPSQRAPNAALSIASTHVLTVYLLSGMCGNA